MGDLAIGIDLGTTYCCVAVYRDGKIEIIPNGVGTNTTPSYVHIDKNNSVTAGTAAKGAALQDPTTAVYDVKRLIGRRFDDPLVQKDMEIWPFKVIEDEDSHFPKFLLNETSYLPEQISAHVLGYLKACAEEWLNRPVKKAVITVPAYFNEAQRHATKLAGAMAGIEVLNLLHEPTAAAVTYCYKNKSFTTEKTILVFDLGGGTFDVVVMSIKDRKIQIKAIGGDSHLGGQDIDRNLVDHCLQEFKAKNGIDLTLVESARDEVKVAKMLRRLKNECEEIKTQLSYNKNSVITLDNLHGDTSLVVKITREKFERLNDSLLQKCVDTVEAVIADANLTPGDIDEVIMVGGSSRIPKLQELVMGLFEDRKPNRTINADEAVACGAAIQAALMTVDCPALKNIFPDMKIRDAVSLSVGTKLISKSATTKWNAQTDVQNVKEFPSLNSFFKISGQVDTSELNGNKDIPKNILLETTEDDEPDKMSMALQIIKNGLILKNIFKIENSWRTIWGLTEYRESCEKLLERRGIKVFLNCLNAFPNERELQRVSFGTFTQVAEVKHLRTQLMTPEFINVIYNSLDSAKNAKDDDYNCIAYSAVEILTHILSDGVGAWTIESPSRSDVLSRVRLVVKSWEYRLIEVHFSTLGEFSRLLNVSHTSECQLFAAWSLWNLTAKNPEDYVPLLVWEGGLDILNKMTFNDEDVRKFVTMTLKKTRDYLSQK